MRSLVLLAVLLGLVAPAGASAAVTLAAGAPVTGAVHLVASGADRIVEQAGGAEVPVAATASATGLEARPAFTCTTRRTFVALAGAERSAPLTVTTPACAERLRIAQVHRVGLGGNLRITLLDRWEQGAFTTTVCVRPPRGKRRCEPVTMAPGQYVMHAVFRATRTGRWKATVRDPWHAVTLPSIAVERQRRSGKPVVLFTGDSMMLAPGQVLQHALRGSARVVDDVYVGSGISSPLVVDWAKLPRGQVRAYRPDAVVLSLGMDDSGDLPSPDGAIHCCGEDFVAAYAQRAEGVMRTYLRGGTGAVVWLNVPLARDPRRWPSENAVNAAVARAALGLDRVRVVDVHALLTPSGYAQDGTIDGKRVRLRTSDGIHMTATAARYVMRPALDALHADFGVVAR